MRSKILAIAMAALLFTATAQTQTTRCKRQPMRVKQAVLLPKKSLLRPRFAPPKPSKIVIDPERSIAGVFIIKFVEGSHVRLGPNGLMIDERGGQSNAEQQQQQPTLSAALMIDEKGVQSNREEERRLARVGLKPGGASKELNRVSEILRKYQASHGFNLGYMFRPPQFVYSPAAEDADAPFREKDELEQRSGEELADLDLYYVVYAKDFRDIAAQQKLMNRLNAYRIIEQVHVAVPAEGAQSVTPDISTGQGYLGPAPRGLDGLFAWTQPGGRGEGVRLIDVEWDWVTDHEDFVPDSQRFWGGRPLCPYDGSESEHGTAVMGIIAARDNGLGITGFAPNVQFGLSSGCRPFDYVWAAHVATFSGENWAGRAHNVVMANAMQVAADQLRPGDILLIEQHVPGPGTGTPCPGNCGQWEFVPMEYYSESFDVIRRTTARGVIVVEPAGNGSRNLDTPPYGGRFSPGVRHSGALLVGGSGAGDNMPNGNSNSSQRIDVHAWGASVITLGYGRGGTPPFDGAPRPITRFYTNSFAGTSSAGAIVAGAVASLQGARRAAGRPPLTPIELTALLRATGSPQLGSFSAIEARPIGVQPNLRAAINAATTTGGGFAGPGNYFIRSKSSGMMLDVDVAWFRGQNDGQRLIQWDFHGGLNQQFEIADAGDGLFWLRPRHTGGRTVLDVSGGSSRDGAAIQQWSLTRGDNQRFIIEPVGGYYRIKAAHSGSALDVPGFSREPNVGIIQYQLTGGDNQLFELIPVR